jgi:hypothetical protein
MTDRRLLKVLPGGRSSSKPGLDGEAARHDGPHGHYADPYAVPSDRDRAGNCGPLGRQPGQAPGTRGPARLHLLPPIRRDGERQLPVSYPAALATPQRPQAPDRPVADAGSLLALGEFAADAGGPQNQQIVTGRTTAAGRHRKPVPRTAGDPRFLAKREVHVLWAAHLLSRAAEQIARVAITVLVYGQTRSLLLAAVACALTCLPPLLGGSPVTWLTGKLHCRTLMICLDLARAALIVAMTLPGARLWSMSALLLAALLLGAPFAAARATLILDYAPAGLRRMAWPGPAIGTIGCQAGQALAFLAGAGLVAALQPRRALLIDALIFLASACLVTALVARHRPPLRAADTRALGPSLAAEPASVADAGLVVRSARLRTLALLGWLAGFYLVPECLAVPYARAPGGGTLTAGLLTTAMSAGAALALWALVGVGTAYRMGAAETLLRARR